MNAFLTATPNVSASCPPGTMLAPDGMCVAFANAGISRPDTVPTLSEWGLIALLLILAVVGVRRLA